MAAVPGRPWAGLATGYGFAVVLLPIVTLGGGAGTREFVTTAVAVAVATATALLFGRFAARPSTAWAGPVLVAVAGLLYDVTPAGLATAIIALLVGAGVGLAVGGRPRPALVPGLGGCALGAVTLGGAWALADGPRVPLVVGVLMSLAAVVARALLARGRDTAGDGTVGAGVEPPARARRVLLGVAAAGAVGLLAWTGANDPQLSWFGPVSANGPRDVRQVALTFDDGPNDPYSLDVARILDDHGVKGTFFEVGKAVDAEPRVARQLMDDGHLLGNHSYNHDYWGWLDPRYPELGRTQDAFERNLGVCPRFYRPPHGQRTPFITAQVASRGMRTVTWDVSGGDWDTTDGALVAERILRRVQPGSIILLHDSIDGNVDADRRIVLEALPIILDGLERRGLEPVRIDRMLGGPAYLEKC
jgi:peptidoglycan-N-acetylglucosamine deacetylase